MFHILITGCNGEVGRKVVEMALQDGHTVLGADKTTSNDSPNHPRFTFKVADVCDPGAVMELVEGCNAIIHLAAIRNPGDYLFEAHNV